MKSYQGDMELDQNMMTQLGMMNKLTSGNMVLDVIMCLMLPVILTQLTQYTDTIKEFVKKHLFWEGKGRGYSREIEYAKVDGYYWYDEDNSRNKVRRRCQRRPDLFIEGSMVEQ